MHIGGEVRTRVLRMAKSFNGMGNIGAMLRVLGPLNGANADPVRNRQLLADFCRLVGSRGEKPRGRRSAAAIAADAGVAAWRV